MLINTYKYDIIGQRLATAHGTLIDIGARDRRLKQYLPSSIHYLSADVVDGHDFHWDLEEKIDIPDKSFDIVVALDVLEHLEHIHQAYEEMLRISSHKVFISLPNMTCLSLRLKFLVTGYLGGKYDLLPIHQGDRHRWLTSYNQICRFIEYHAQQKRYEVQRYDIMKGYTRLHRVTTLLPLPVSLRAFTVLFELTKK